MKTQGRSDVGNLIGVARYVVLAAGLICNTVLDLSKRVLSILNMDGASNVASAGGIQKIDFASMRIVNVR